MPICLENILRDEAKGGASFAYTEKLNENGKSAREAGVVIIALCAIPRGFEICILGHEALSLAESFDASHERECN